MSKKSRFQPGTRTIFERILTVVLTLAVLVSMLSGLFLTSPAQPALAAPPTELFISEYIEGSGYNKAIEIYNETGTAIDLSAGGYSLFISFNGGSSTLDIPLTGTVANNDVYVVAYWYASSPPAAAIQAVADQYSTASWYNGDDAVALRKNSVDIDVIGQIGNDPGDYWGVNPITTQNHTLQRKSTICAGDANGGDAFDPSIEWDGYAQDTFSGLGAHSTTCSSTAPNLTINNVTLVESDFGTTSFDFTVSLSSPAPAGGVTFDIATADNTATTADNDYVIKSLTGQSIPEGSSTYSFSILVNGDTNAETDETFFVNVTNVVGATSTDSQGQGTIQDDDNDVCALPFTTIYDIQGSGLSAATTGDVTTQGVVVGDFEGSASASGFYLQDVAGDGDAATSDGIFVYTGSTNTVTAGQVVRVTGYARERYDQTTLNGSNSDSSAVPAANIVNCGADSVAATDVTMPFDNADYPERYEGMLVRLPQALQISEYYNYDQYGEIVLALPLPGEPRAFTGTAIDEPGTAANDRTLANSLRRITLDDANSAQNPATLRHPDGGVFALGHQFRGGDTVQNVVGILGYDYDLYRIVPTGPADYTAVNARPAAPEPVGGSLQVAAMNTLNYFLTADYPTGNPLDNKCGPLQNQECRGWDSDQLSEFTRQRDKLLQALAGLNADVIGLNELENTTGVEPLADIAAGLNTILGAGTYAYINTGVIGTDAIKVGMIYKPASVSPVGSFRILTTAVDPRFLDTKNRPALAQTFEDLSTGHNFTVVVNHLKSKGSACTGDPDLGDGQGNCNLTRKAAAEALVDWLANDPTGSGSADFLIMGDLNSYAMEDPIDAIKAGPDDIAGTGDDYTNLIAQFGGTYAYSYVFDGQFGYLDHALASAGLLSKVTGATEWHINADEPDILDYDTSFKPPSQDALYEPNQYRTSDHDAVIVGLLLATDTYAEPSGNCGGNIPCYTSIADAIGNVLSTGTAHIYAGTYNSGMNVNNNTTVRIEGNVILTGDFTQSTGTVDFVGTNQLTVGGDFTRSGGSFNANTGTVAFNGGGLQTITGETTFNNLTINNSGAGVALGSTTTVNNILTLTDGLLDLGASNLELGPLATISGGSVDSMVVTSGGGALSKCSIAVGEYTFPVGDKDGTPEYSPATLNFTALAGSGCVSVKVTNQIHPQNMQLPRLSRYWTLGQTGLTSFTCEGSFSYTEADLNTGAGATENNLKAIKYSEGAWTISATPVDTENNRLLLTMNSFSDVTGGSNDPTAAILASSQAYSAPAAVQVTWETASELEVIGFNIFRAEKLDGARTSVNTALLAANHPGDVGGSSYSYLDVTAQPGQIYYYWIDVITASGNILSPPMPAAAWYALFLPAVSK